MAHGAGGKHRSLWTPERTPTITHQLPQALAPLVEGEFAPIHEALPMVLPAQGSAQPPAALSLSPLHCHYTGAGSPTGSGAFPESQGGFPACRGSCTHPKT